MGKIVSFVKDADEAVAYEVGSFMGAGTSDGTKAMLRFKKADGTGAQETVQVDFADNDGLGFKRACMAVANAFGGGRQGSYRCVANLLTGEFVGNITGVDTP